MKNATKILGIFAIILLFSLAACEKNSQVKPISPGFELPPAAESPAGGSGNNAQKFAINIGENGGGYLDSFLLIDEKSNLKDVVDNNTGSNSILVNYISPFLFEKSGLASSDPNTKAQSDQIFNTYKTEWKDWANTHQRNLLVWERWTDQNGQFQYVLFTIEPDNPQQSPEQVLDDHSLREFNFTSSQYGTQVIFDFCGAGLTNN